MSWAVTRNGRPLPVGSVPLLEMAEWQGVVRGEFREPRRVVALLDLPGPPRQLLLVLADDERSRLLVNRAALDGRDAYPALTPEIPAFHLFERELHEGCGIQPRGHPWLKPVRYPHGRGGMAGYPFFVMAGEEVHEVGVGPIHAGVIEPGHFRFMCHGETVHHLEIQLGYQHRGVEELFMRESRAGRLHVLPHLAESIAGDSSVAHALAWAAAWEALAGLEVPQRGMAIRGLALEMERAAVHIGDLGAICNDIAHLSGCAVYQAERTRVINSLMKICGSRYGRGLVRLGGVGEDIPPGRAASVQAALSDTAGRAAAMGDALFSSAGALARFENTGVVEAAEARRIGMVGLAARASGLAVDVRSDHPFGIYRFAPVFKRTMESGDVLARAFLRHLEWQQSLDYARARLDDLPPGNWRAGGGTALAGDQLVVALVEGWRGEIAHVAVTGGGGRLQRYKIKDPSFHNWFGLALAVRGDGISDFPLCNKSFDLSYCGHDL